MQKTDETLVVAAQKGDKIAEEEILVRYRNLVRYCARKFFLIGGETEDLIPEGLIGLYQAIGSYKSSETGASSFKNFVFLCVWRRIVDAVKKASNKREIIDVSLSVEDELLFAASNPEESVILDDDRRELNVMMSRELTDFEFKVFSNYMDGASCAEICQLTGKSPKSVDNAVQRSKQKLRKALKNQG